MLTRPPSFFSDATSPPAIPDNAPALTSTHPHLSFSNNPSTSIPAVKACKKKTFPEDITLKQIIDASGKVTGHTVLAVRRLEVLKSMVGPILQLSPNEVLFFLKVFLTSKSD
jgi:hypothetical protein